VSAPSERPSVERVRAALAWAGSTAEVIELAETARSAREAADSLGVALGAIVKSLVFTVGGEPALALVAGDRRCDGNALAAALGLAGDVRRADADTVRASTGFAIGGVPPLGHANPLPTVLDPSLKRFATVYAAAGHPHCVFATTVDELTRLAKAAVVEGLGVEG
jgi:prolyl-tRNA editing enzyme YbaK/EbsC (Cys-tRNA(Pro) deacylase)